jgi:hypothetical protein
MAAAGALQGRDVNLASISIDDKHIRGRDPASEVGTKRFRPLDPRLRWRAAASWITGTRL